MYFIYILSRYCAEKVQNTAELKLYAAQTYRNIPRTTPRPLFPHSSSSAVIDMNVDANVVAGGIIATSGATVVGVGEVVAAAAAAAADGTTTTEKGETRSQSLGMSSSSRNDDRDVIDGLGGGVIVGVEEKGEENDGSAGAAEIVRRRPRSRSMSHSLFSTSATDATAAAVAPRHHRSVFVGTSSFGDSSGYLNFCPPDPPPTLRMTTTAHHPLEACSAPDSDSASASPPGVPPTVPPPLPPAPPPPPPRRALQRQPTVDPILQRLPRSVRWRMHLGLLRAPGEDDVLAAEMEQSEAAAAANAVGGEADGERGGETTEGGGGAGGGG